MKINNIEFKNFPKKLYIKLKDGSDLELLPTYEDVENKFGDIVLINNQLAITMGFSKPLIGNVDLWFMFPLKNFEICSPEGMIEKPENDNDLAKKFKDLFNEVGFANKFCEILETTFIKEYTNIKGRSFNFFSSDTSSLDSIIKLLEKLSKTSEEKTQAKYASLHYKLSTLLENRLELINQANALANKLTIFENDVGSAYMHTLKQL